MMDDTQQGHGHDDDSLLAALDFGDEPDHQAGAALEFRDDSGADTPTVLDFDDEVGNDDPEPSAIDVLDTDEPAESVDTETRHAVEILSEDADVSEAISDPDKDSGYQLTTVTNPPETVSVTASIGGRIHRVELSPEVANMTESELANEIRVITHLAQQRAKSMLHTLLKGCFNETGADDNDVLDDFLGGMDLSSPKQASEAQAKVFATRYASDNA